MQWTQTEAETWEALARAIERGGRVHPRLSCRWGQARTWGGLCSALDALRWIADMPDEQHRAMALRVASHGPPKGLDAYRWPLTPAGDRQRAAFCRRMAKLARRDQP